jgi:hypothetical protein
MNFFLILKKRLKGTNVALLSTILGGQSLDPTELLDVSDNLGMRSMS